MVNRRGANWQIALGATALLAISTQASGDSAVANNQIQFKPGTSVNGLGGSGLNGLGGSGTKGVGGSGLRGVGGSGASIRTLNSNPTSSNVGGVRGLGGTGIKTSNRAAPKRLGNYNSAPAQLRTKPKTAQVRGLGGTGVAATTNRANQRITGLGGSGAKRRSNPQGQRRVNRRAGVARK